MAAVFAFHRQRFATCLTLVLVAVAPVCGACPQTVPDGLKFESVGEEMVVNGLPVVIKQVSGRESADALLSRVEKTWQDDRYAVKRKHAGGWDVLSARSDTCLTTLQLRDNEGAIGFFSIGKPDHLQDRLPKQMNVPLPGGATVDSAVSSVDGARRGYTVQFSSKRSVDDINDYFLNQLSSSGWQAVTSHEIRGSGGPRGRQSRIVSAQKGNQQVSVVLWSDGRTRALLNLLDAL